MNTKHLSQIILISLIISIITLSSCKERVKIPPIDIEQELITTVELNFTDSADVNNVRTFRFTDPDGPGGIAAVTDSISLQVNRTYYCNIRFLDESDSSNIEDISLEVLEEGKDHFLCLTGLEDAGIAMDFDIADNNGYPIPLNSTWRTGNVADASLSVVLKHKVDHSHTDCNEGETDVEVSFKLYVDQ